MSGLPSFVTSGDEHGLAPDCILPCQLSSKCKDSPLSRLLFAILEDAVNCYAHSIRCYAPRACRGCRDRDEARAWVAGVVNPPFLSFTDVCDELSIDAPAFARALAAKYPVPKSPDAGEGRFVHRGGQPVTLRIRRENWRATLTEVDG